MGACASKLKDFKDDAPPEAAAQEVKLVEETVSKDEVPAAAVVEDGEAKTRSLGHFLKEMEAEKGLPTSPKPVGNAEAKGVIEKAPPATLDDLKSNNPEEDIKPDSINVGVETSEKETAVTEKTETLDKCEEQKIVSVGDTTKPETAEGDKKIEENTKIETPAIVVEDDDKQVVEPTKMENPVDEKKPVSDAAKNPKDGEEKTYN